MPLVRHTASSLRARSQTGQLFEDLSGQFLFEIGHRPSPSEVRSWERSIPVLLDDLEDAGLGNVEVLLEYRLPLNSKRADVVLCGVHPKTGNASYVVVELKQWSHAVPVEGTEDVILAEGYDRRLLHPVAQVRGYCEYMSDMVAAFGGEGELISGVAYLHNAADGDVGGLFDLSQDRWGRLFTSSRRREFLDFLKSKLSSESGADSADQLMNSAVRPSKQLLSLAADEVQNREQFVLLDEQQVAYSMTMSAVRRANEANSKTVVIVTGGPGSGKSVIALSLMGELSRQGRSVLHATGSSAFTQTLRKVAGSRAPRVQKLFTYYNQFIDAEKNGIDVLINDEAHRVKETSTNRWTPAAKRTGRPQVEELIDAARVPVFLLDEHQVVRPGEKGTIKDIEDAATRLGCAIERVDLNGQFRCGGSQQYENWVLRLLGLEPGGAIPWAGDDSFELDLAAGPDSLESRLRTLIGQGYQARISAGYCWDWSKPEVDYLVPDVQIGDWKRPWNNQSDKRVGAAPGRPFWASDPAGFDQVGCIYTAQGFEYDYSGVIIGPDLVWRDGVWVARREYSHDRQVKGADSEAFERAIKNTYKVLLTRGMRGTYVYSTDKETQEYLESVIRPKR